MYTTVLLLVLMISICEACGQSLTYIANKHKKYWLLILAWIAYIGVVYFLFKSYALKGVGYINILWSGITTVMMICIGYIFFKERLTKVEWLGACFIFVGIILMTYHQATSHMGSK